jgi:deoxycytidylate deaminase
MIANAGIKKIYFGEFYRDERIKKHAKELKIDLIHLKN